MHAEADPERGDAGSHFFDEWRREPETVQVAHSVAERAHARENELRSNSYVVRVGRDAHVMAEAAQGVFQAAEVIQLVINDRDHGHSTPFVDGISACSTRVAKCKARAVALKIVSAMW